MNPGTNKHNIQTKRVPLLIVLIVSGAVVLGWWLGRSSAPPSTLQPTDTAQTSTPSSNSAGPDVRSLVTYRLPDGWQEATCPNATGSIFIIPAGVGAVDCASNPSSPVKISVDPSNSDDCNDLQNVVNVSKHTCISLYINDNKSLKAETIYNQNSSSKKPTTINAYYINTGKGVIKVEYVHAPDDNGYQAGFDQLAMSVRAK